HHLSRLQREIQELNLPVSVNNLWTETQAIKLNGRVSIPRVVNRNHPDYRVGHSDRFWILNSVTDHYYLSKATILCETSHLYIYVSSGVRVGKSACRRSARRFEHYTYP